MSSSPPEFRVRAAGPEDVERAYRVVLALDEHVGVDTGLEVEDVREMSRTLDAAWLWERDGTAVAYASLRLRGERYEGNGFVHPSFFGRGLGTAIVETLEARARKRGAKKLGGAILGGDERAARLLEAHGYRELRHFYRMTIDMDEPPPLPHWPEGLEPRPFVAERDGDLAGYADFRCDEDGVHAYIDLRVRSGSGAADALLEAAEASLAGCLARCFVSERDDDAKRVLARRGYRLIRHSFQMQIDLEARPEPPSWPRGFAVRTYGPEDEQAVYECQQEAFADHWDFRPTPLELWRKFSLERPSFDPTPWWLAESGGELAGICLGDWHASGDRAFGWIGSRSLAVRRQWRGQGLGLALLR